MSQELRIKLLGSPAAFVGDEPVSGFVSIKAQALLYYLTATGEAHRRDTLAALLWSDIPDARAKKNLRDILSNLRQLAGPFLIITRQEVGINPGTATNVDSHNFLQALAALRDMETPTAPASAQALQSLAEAVDLHKGEFLAGFYAPDAPLFEQWMLAEREHLRLELGHALELLVSGYSARRAYKSGTRYAEQWSALDPLQEIPHRSLMQLHAAEGNRPAAIKQYHELKNLLGDELGVEPTPETTTLYRQIRAGDIGARVPVQGELNIRGYELCELINDGHYAAIYRAYQPMTGRNVAIKVIKASFANQPDFIRRFELEAQLVVSLEHPYIVPLYDYWREPDCAFLVMRWLPGGSLEDLLREGPLDLFTTVTYMDQVASALKLAHQQGFVHRDIKPANILLDEAGNAYLSDFGIVKDLSGESMRTQTGAVIGTPSYLSPEQALSEPATPLSDQYSLAVTLYEMLTGVHAFDDTSPASLIIKQANEPLPLVRSSRPELPPAIDECIQQATAKEPSARYPDIPAMLRALHMVARIDGLSYPPPVRLLDGDQDLVNPYQGLRSFQEADAANFFGRNALVEKLLHRFDQAPHTGLTVQPSAVNRFLAVVGPSGSGKSSAVKAGLIPALRRGAVNGSDKWFIVEMVPGTHPLEELEAALLGVAINPPTSLLGQLQEDDRGLLRAVKRILPPDESELLLLIDQFEEVYALVESDERRSHFINSLLAALAEHNSRIRIVLTLRADFYDRPLRTPTLAELMQRCLEIVPPLTRAELEEVIVQPALQAGALFEAGLVPTIIDDVGEQPGALPLLQYALTELFERRQERLLTQAAYTEIGGVLGALGRRAEDLYAELDAAGQEAARQLSMRLVTLGEGTEDTRRRVLRSELTGLIGALRKAPLQNEEPLQNTAVMETVIDAYGRYRLLTFDHDPLTRESTVEVAHEALLHEWERMRNWLDENRADLRLQRSLAASAAEWAENEQDEGFLLRGSRLDMFSGWAAGMTLALTPDERSYLQASVAAREQRKIEEQARQQRELETAQRLAQEQAQRAEEQGRSARRLRLFAAGLTIALLIALGTALLAYNARSTAQREAEVNRSLVLATSAEEAMEAGEGDRALALALKAASINDPPPEAVSKLASVAYGQGTRARLSGHSAAVPAGTFSPDGDEVLSGSCGQEEAQGACTAGELIRWDVDGGEEAAHWAAHDDWVTAVAWHPDGDRALTGGGDGSLIIWDMASNTAVIEQQVHDGAINAIAFSPDNAMAAIAADDGTISLVDVAAGKIMRRFEGHEGAVLDVAFSPDGQQLVSGGADTLIMLWDVASGDTLNTFAGHTHFINGVAFLDEGAAIVSGSEDQSFRKWDIATGEQRQLRETGDSTEGMALSPDGHNMIHYVAHVIYSWDPGQFDGPHQKLIGHESQIYDLAFSNDGQLALSTSEDGTVRVWSMGGSDVQQTTLGFSAIGVAVSPDGSALAISSWGPNVELWNVATNEPLQTLSGATGILGPGAVDFSADGRYVVGGSGDFFQESDASSVVVWELATGKMVCNFQEHVTEARTVAFSPDSKTLLSGSMGSEGEGDLILWNTATCDIVHRLPTDDNVAGVDFSTDGHYGLSSSNTGQMTLWDLATGKAVRVFEVPGDYFLDAAFGPRDETVLASAISGIIVQWDRETGEEINRFIGHDGGAWAIDVSEDGRWLASSDDAGLVILWDLASGAPLRRHHVHTSPAFHLTFSPDDQTVYSVSVDETLAAWQIGDPSLEGLLAWIEDNRYVRELTCEEREQYGVEPFCK